MRRWWSQRSPADRKLIRAGLLQQRRRHVVGVKGSEKQHGDLRLEAQWYGRVPTRVIANVVDRCELIRGALEETGAGRDDRFEEILSDRPVGSKVDMNDPFCVSGTNAASRTTSRCGRTSASRAIAPRPRAFGKP